MFNIEDKHILLLDHFYEWSFTTNNDITNKTVTKRKYV